MSKLWSVSIRRLRTNLRVSRVEFSRFLGVSEATVVRWESDASMTEPKGVQAVLLQALLDVASRRSPEEVARVVRSCGLDHRNALRELLEAASSEDRSPTSVSDVWD